MPGLSSYVKDTVSFGKPGGGIRLTPGAGRAYTKGMLVYHGCPSPTAGASILDSGILRPRETSGRGLLAPVAKRVYFTPELRTAAIYALGGVFMGAEPNEHIMREGKEGFVFTAEVDPAKCIPDEDCVGFVLAESSRLDDPVSPYSDHPTLARALREEPGMAYSLADTIGRAMTANQRHLAEEGYIAYMASGGKRALPKLSERQRVWMIEHGSNLSHLGEVRWQAAWKLDKQLCRNLAHDGSNLLEVATPCLPARVSLPEIPSLSSVPAISVALAGADKSPLR